MKTSIVLRNESKTTGLSSIYIEYSNYPKVKRFPTGIKIPKSYWNEDKQVIKKGGTDDVGMDNDNLKDAQGKIERMIKDFFKENSRYPLCEELGEIYEASVKPKQEKTFDDYFGEFIDRKEVELSPNTIKSFKQVRGNLNDFAVLNKIKLNFEIIDYGFFEKFKAYYIGKGHKNTTISKRLKVLKEFLNDGIKLKIHNNPITKEYQVKLPKQKNKEVVTLSIAELEAFKELNLTGNPRLERVRDLFLLQSWTGLRYSDIIRLKKIHTVTGQIIMDNQKTKSVSELPLFPEALRILEKYDYQIRKISNDKYNEYLKEICQMLPELTKTTITQIHYSGNKRIEQTEPKYKFIGTHTARRNFITLMIDLDVKIPQIMKWSNHSTLAMFQGYINRKQAEQSETDKVITQYNKQVEALKKENQEKALEN